MKYGPSLSDTCTQWQNQPLVTTSHYNQFSAVQRTSIQTFGICGTPLIVPLQQDQSLYVVQNTSFMYPVVSDCETMARSILSFCSTSFIVNFKEFNFTKNYL
ncbi:hypothetical protein GJ496_001993 [Pomphorhynchus laevis]|nr:hypothetical protein GJ496_001993 [Pomphorhynchus laevis]